MLMSTQEFNLLYVHFSLIPFAGIKLKKNKAILCLNEGHPHKSLTCFKNIHFIFTLLVNSLNIPECLCVGNPLVFMQHGASVVYTKWNLKNKQWTPHGNQALDQQKSFSCWPWNMWVLLPQDGLLTVIRILYVLHSVISVLKNKTSYQKVNLSAAKQKYKPFKEQVSFRVS